MSKIIAISGKIGSGKDTFAKMIQYEMYKKYNGGLEGLTPDFQTFAKYPEGKRNVISEFEIVRFADKIKDTVCLWLGCTREELEDREFKEKPLGEQWDKYGVSWNCPSDQVEAVFSTYEEAEEYARAEGAKPVDIDRAQIIRKIQMTPRKLLQLLGTECGRQIIHPDIWVNTTFADLKQDSQWIIPDMRFPNEKERAEEYGALSIRVERKIAKRFPELYMEYGYSGSTEEQNERHFLSYLRREYPELHSKLTHDSETSLDDVEDWEYVIYNNFSLDVLHNVTKKILKEENLL